MVTKALAIACDERVERAVAGFGKEMRLLNAADFKRVFDAPDQRSVDPMFTLLARKNELGYPRLGMAITKKRLKRAVDRNRAKRIIRESFRLWQRDLGSYDFVVMNRNALVGAENPAQFHSLDKHWARLIRRCKSA